MLPRDLREAIETNNLTELELQPIWRLQDYLNDLKELAEIAAREGVNNYLASIKAIDNELDPEPENHNLNEFIEEMMDSEYGECFI